MNYWIMKSEPNAFSIDDLAASPKQTTYWDGVRNYQVRNMLRDQMQKGDLAFFYHSNCKPPGIVGVMKIVKTGYPDHTAFDKNDEHYDPKSDPDNPRWFMVDVEYQRKLKCMISLDELKQAAILKNLPLIRKGNRLSIVPVTQKEWDGILKLA